MGVMQMTNGAYASGPRGRSWILRLLVGAVTLLIGAQTTWTLAVLYGGVMTTLLLVSERRRLV